VRKGANLFPIIGAVVALQAIFSIASLASNGGDPEERAKQAGEDRWVPSLAITSGPIIQTQQGSADSCAFPGSNNTSRGCDSRGNPPDLPLRGFGDGNDLAVDPFVGGSLELMAPALPIPMRPRLFVSGEILPTFASDRRLALEGDPGCIRGPEPDVGCAKNEPVDANGLPLRDKDFGQDSVNGAGSRTSAQIGTLVFGASLGVAFPLQVGNRQLRIKPSVGWINYKVEVEGLVVDAACDPANRCTDVTGIIGLPPDPGFLRETILTASDSQRFNGIGPGLDVEMDTGQFGPIGSSLFLGARAYRILGNRTISFGTEKNWSAQNSDPLDPFQRIVFGPETDVGAFEVEVDPWIFRAHVGIRFQWLGSQQ
jgi:hypothetical protein